MEINFFFQASLDHVINGSCDLVGGMPSPQDTKIVLGTKKLTAVTKMYVLQKRITSWGKLVLQILLNNIKN